MPDTTILPMRCATVAAMCVAAVGLAACGSSSKTNVSTPSTPSPVAAPSTAAAPIATSPTTPPPATAGKVTVALSEYKIKPDVASVATGRVTFDVSNTGHLKHQFTVIRTTKPASSALSKIDPNDDIPGARGEIASIAPGATKKLVIKNLKAGHYAFVCALPGHYQGGMFADFTVK